MADDVTNRGPQDRARISMTEAREVRYWTKELGVSKERLASVVARSRKLCRSGTARTRQIGRSDHRVSRSTIWCERVAGRRVPKPHGQCLLVR
jgi:hypothetical protein